MIYIFDSQQKIIIINCVFASYIFIFQTKLPKLPVPLLERTTKLYLETLKPILNEKQYEHARKLVADFTSGPGPMLQEILLERREEHDNWVRWMKNTDIFIISVKPNASRSR